MKLFWILGAQTNTNNIHVSRVFKLILVYLHPVGHSQEAMYLAYIRWDTARKRCLWPTVRDQVIDAVDLGLVRFSKGTF